MITERVAPVLAWYTGDASDEETWNNGEGRFSKRASFDRGTMWRSAARSAAQRSDQTSDLSALVIDIGRPRRVPIASHRSHCYSPFTAFAYRKPRNMRHRRRRFHRGQDPEYQMFQLFVQGKRGRRGSARTAFNHARYENLERDTTPRSQFVRVYPNLSE